MTALVGILNKRAAVIAADSAVTITRGDKTKINNTANKIFRLSNTNPLGVMIYGNSEYMGIPWEVLFKLYRDTGRDKPFDTLMEYVEDFIDFLKNEKHCCNEENQKDYLDQELASYYFKIQELYTQDYEEAIKNNGDDNIDTESLMLKCLNDNFEFIDNKSDESGTCPEFEKYTLKALITKGKSSFDRLEGNLRDEKTPGTRKEWEKHFFKYIKSSFFLGREAGLVFVGYGEKDLFPSIIPLIIAGNFDGRIRYYIDKEKAEYIANDNTASICPFAQSDIMISLLKGINPSIYDTVYYKFCDSMEAVRQKMIDAVKDAGVAESVTEGMASIELNEITDKFQDDVMEYIRTAFTDGVVDAVDSFNIDDMIKMAESLISITNLQRHFSSSEESVGGPVDVAVITKSEGFVWVNRKQWYQKELNPQQIERR